MATHVFGRSQAMARCSVLGCGLLLGLVAASQARAQSAACPPGEAEAADMMVDKPGSWQAIEQDFKHYRQCDDGSIAEGTSEAVARLMVDRWQTLPALAERVRRDPTLEAFVLRHIDTTVDTHDLDRIARFSSQACPKSAGAVLCRRINDAAVQALR